MSFEVEVTKARVSPLTFYSNLIGPGSTQGNKGHGHGQGSSSNIHADPSSFRESPEHPTIVTTQHHDVYQAHYPEQDLSSRPFGDYSDPFGQAYEIPHSPQPVPMPAPRPYPAQHKSFSDQQMLGYQGRGAGGLVRKVSTRIQQAIEAAKVPYQPVYPSTLDEETGYQHGRAVDLHGELRDEWEMAPVIPPPIPGNRPPSYLYTRPEFKDDQDGQSKPLDATKPESTDDEKYLVSYPLDDMRHPFNWPNSKKYTILLVLCLAAVCVTATSSIQASTYTSIEREFGFSRPEAVLGVSLYVLGLGLGSSESSRVWYIGSGN